MRGWKSFEGVATLVAAFALFVIAVAGIIGPLPGAGLGGVAAGARAWMVVVLPAIWFSLILGIPLGLVSARVGRLGDRLVTRSLEFIGGFPTIVVVALLRASAPEAPTLFVALTLSVVRIPETARLVRLLTVRFLASDTYMATRAMGVPPLRLFFVHMLPGMFGGIASTAVVGVGVLVGIEAAMSFVGLAAPHDVPSWGSAIGKAVASGDLVAALGPASALGVTILALYKLADGLRARLAP